MKNIIEIKDFQKIEIATGQIIKATKNSKARKPAYILDIDFGSKYGMKKSSAQITENYTLEELVGTQIIAIINLKPLGVAGIKSEVLVLAVVCKDNGIILVSPNKPTSNGQILA